MRSQRMPRSCRRTRFLRASFSRPSSTRSSFSRVFSQTSCLLLRLSPSASACLRLSACTSFSRSCSSLCSPLIFSMQKCTSNSTSSARLMLSGKRSLLPTPSASRDRIVRFSMSIVSCFERSLSMLSSRLRSSAPTSSPLPSLVCTPTSLPSRLLSPLEPPIGVPLEILEWGSSWQRLDRWLSSSVHSLRSPTVVKWCLLAASLPLPTPALTVLNCPRCLWSSLVFSCPSLGLLLEKQSEATLFLGLVESFLLLEALLGGWLAAARVDLALFLRGASFLAGFTWPLCMIIHSGLA